MKRITEKTAKNEKVTLLMFWCRTLAYNQLISIIK